MRCASSLALLLSCGVTARAANVFIPLSVNEPAGVTRSGSIVTSGVPLPRGRVTETTDLRILDLASGQAIPAQVRPLAQWRDGSLKWVLADFPATVGAGGSASYALTEDGHTPLPQPPLTMSVTTAAQAFTVDTGVASFVVPRAGFRMFQSLRVGTSALVAAPGSDLVLRSASVEYDASHDAASTVTLEESGPLRATLHAVGTFKGAGGNAFLAYEARLHFYAGSSAVRLVLTLKNDAAAVHPNNVWDLGSSGSRYFDDLSLVVPLATSGTMSYTLAGEPPTPLAGTLGASAVLYQESSGGNRWNWNTHVNRFNTVPMSLRGYEVRVNGAAIASGNRARGLIDLSSTAGGLSATVRDFWQNFPKALRARAPATVELGLWPDEFPDVHEIQGGEEKTHELLLYFHEGTEATAKGLATLDDLANPLRARPAYYEAARTQAVGEFGPRDTTAFANYENTVEYMAFAKGDRSFFTQREMIDEYGWRDFGEAMADHETDCGTQCWDCPISHDNNQYDYDWAAYVMWLRDGRPDWFRLGDEGERHLMDIDVYHTGLDTPAYNHGLFWHTTHDTNAYTSAHRTYSALMSPVCTPYLSGGPAPGHLYSEGLELHGYLTGDRRAFAVADELLGYVQTRYALDAPAPGSGYETRAWANALRTAVAGYRRTWDPALYAFAMQVVSDSAAATNPNVDGTVFGDSMLMVALGRFLDMKLERGESADADALKAFASHAAYAQRVRANYPPKQDVLDFRYSEALWYAYKHAPQNDPDKASWAALGKAFFEAGEQSGFFNAYITCKGLAHTASNGQLHTYFERGRIPAPVQLLKAIKAGADVVLSWQPVASDIDGNATALAPHRVHRAVAYASRFTDAVLAASPATTWAAVGDVSSTTAAFLAYEVRAVAAPGIEGY